VTDRGLHKCYSLSVLPNMQTPFSEMKKLELCAANSLMSVSRANVCIQDVSYLTFANLVRAYSEDTSGSGQSSVDYTCYISLDNE